MPAFVDLITNPENYGRLYKPKAISAQTTVDILKTIAEYVNSRVLSRVSDLEDYPDHDDDDGYHGGNAVVVTFTQCISLKNVKPNLCLLGD
ncbi:hypothetical protein BGZ67_000792 [Mortierella alpina]|nr:hypothetical protein BGZ67_000792 [Mortierella alpina]